MMMDRLKNSKNGEYWFDTSVCDCDLSLFRPERTLLHGKSRLAQFGIRRFRYRVLVYIDSNRFFLLK